MYRLPPASMQAILPPPSVAPAIAPQQRAQGGLTPRTSRVQPLPKKTLVRALAVVWDDADPAGQPRLSCSVDCSPLTSSHSASTAPLVSRYCTRAARSD